MENCPTATIFIHFCPSLHFSLQNARATLAHFELKLKARKSHQKVRQKNPKGSNRKHFKWPVKDVKAKESSRSSSMSSSAHILERLDAVVGDLLARGLAQLCAHLGIAPASPAANLSCDQLSEDIGRCNFSSSRNQNRRKKRKTICFNLAIRTSSNCISIYFNMFQ